jgi:hypothetical protein
MKTLYSVIALSPALAIAGTLTQPAQAQTANQSMYVARLYASLQRSVCRNDWNQALRLTSRLIGSPDITPVAREQLVRFRYHLEDWRAAKSLVENIPECESAIAPPNAVESSAQATSLTSLNPANVSVHQLNVALKSAVCRNSWGEALRVSDRLSGSPEITAGDREKLVQFRYQLANWRASKALVGNIPFCQGVTAAPIPEQSDRVIDWANP